MAIESGKPCEAELTSENQAAWPHADRGWLSRAVPVRDADGAVTGAIETIFDIGTYVSRFRSQKKTTDALLRLLQYATSHTTKELLREFLDEAEPPLVDAVLDLPGGDATVLLVEDDDAVRHTTGIFLESLGYEVLTAANSEEAVNLSSEHPGPVPLLLTDVILPGMDGRRLAERLTRQRPEMKCLFMSGYTSDTVADRGVLDTDVDFLPKPVPRDQLARRVFEVLQSTP